MHKMLTFPLKETFSIINCTLPLSVVCCCLTCTSGSTERPVGSCPLNKMQAETKANEPRTAANSIHSLLSLQFTAFQYRNMHIKAARQTLHKFWGNVQENAEGTRPLPSIRRCWSKWTLQPLLLFAGELQPAAEVRYTAWCVSLSCWPLRVFLQLQTKAEAEFLLSSYEKAWRRGSAWLSRKRSARFTFL